MRTKIVYVLVSRESDYYTEELMFSSYSLFLHNPDTEVIIVCDNETSERLSNIEYFNANNSISIRSVEFDPKTDLRTRSRVLKTTLRERVEGDFLFLDTDTVVCKRLDEVDTWSFEIAMVYDTNRKDKLNDSDVVILEKCNSINSEVKYVDAPYFNSGVIFAKDTTSVRQFYKQWHSNWLKFTETGNYTDQPPLCVTNKISGCKIEKLSDRWNCQFKYGCSPKEAKILHYMNPTDGILSFDRPYSFLIFEQIRYCGFSSDYIKELLLNPESTLVNILSINKESFGEMCTSDIINVWVARPKTIMKFAKYISNLTRIRHKIKKKYLVR